MFRLLRVLPLTRKDKTAMSVQPIKGGSFLFEDRKANEIFTREDISEEQQMFARVTEEFMMKEILPRAEQIYSKDWALTRELLVKAGELDLLRIDIPEAYGGLGLDKVSSAYVGEQIALMPSFGASLGAHTTIGTLPIVYFGTPEQRAKYLPKLATGELIAAYCLTEPGSGSDALAARTKATLSEDGKHYLLRGQKMWITNGGFADVYIVFAKVDGEKFTAFIVERGEGVTPGHEEKKLGLDGSSTTAVMLEDASVPVENVLGEVGRGHVVAFNILNLGRLKLGSRNIGGAKISLNNAIAYSKESQPNAEEAVSDILDRTMIDTGVEGLKYVRGALARVKETARLALAAAQHNYDGKLSEEQEAGALAADIVIEAYA